MHTKSLDSRTVRGARAHRGAGAVAVIATLMAAALLSACGSSSSPTSSTSSTANGPTPTAILNTRHVAFAIEQSILAERHVHAKVFCPKVMPQQKGRNFACIATIGTTKTPFAVTQRNNKGYVTYRAQ
jgi:hypothetical protein